MRHTVNIDNKTTLSFQALPTGKVEISLTKFGVKMGSYEADVSVIGLVSTAATMAVDDATADATRLS